jgi:hypothetical protein
VLFTSLSADENRRVDKAIFGLISKDEKLHSCCDYL